MSLVHIDRNPSPRKLHVFGLGWLAMLGVIGGIMWHRGYVSLTGVSIIWAVGVTVPAVGYFVPAVLRWTHLGLSYLTWPIGFVLSHVILALVYYGVFTPVGLLMRLVRYDPMERRFDSERESYWVEREQVADPSRYFRQF